MPPLIENAPKIDEDNNEVVTKFFEKYISCSLPNPDKYTELNVVVKRVQTHHYTLGFWNKKEFMCKFDAP